MHQINLHVLVVADGGDESGEAEQSIAPSDPASMKLQSEEAAKQKADERNRFRLRLAM